MQQYMGETKQITWTSNSDLDINSRGIKQEKYAIQLSQAK